MSANPFEDWLAFSSDAPVNDSYLPPSSPLPLTPSSNDDQDDGDNLAEDALLRASPQDELVHPIQFFSGDDRPEGEEISGASYSRLSI